MKPLKVYSFFIILIVVLLAIYWTNLFNPDVPTLDQKNIIEPLYNITSLYDYINVFHEKKIYDIQPIRDLSHLLDIWIYEKTELFVGLLSNFILFFLSIIFLYKLLNFYYEKKISLILIYLYAIHPVFTAVILVETSRKHLLSFTFTIILLYLIKKYDLKGVKNKFIAYFFYIFSCFSQPINLASPSFIFLKEKVITKKVKKNFIKILPFGIICLAVIIINLYYYNFIFAEQTGFSKQAKINLGESFLAIGRMAFQFFIPQSYSIFYYKGGIANIIGLYLLVFILFYAWKIGRKYVMAPFFILYVSVIFILYHKQTNVFYLDTYILTPSLFFLVIIGETLRRIKTQKYLLIIVGITFIGLGAKTIQEVRDRDNYYRFIEKKFEKEPACEAYEYYLYMLYTKNKIEKMKDIGEKWVSGNCFYYNKDTYLNHIYYLSLLIYFNDEFSLAEKEKLFHDKKNGGENIKLFEELVRLRLKKTGAAQNILEIFKRFSEHDKSLCFARKIDIIVEEIYRYCDDESLSCKYLKDFILKKECFEK